MSESEHDAWLREALRHAPDAEVTPSARLRAQILQQASAATNGGMAAQANPLRWFGALFERPVWATGLASVFVAVIAVSVWSPWSGAPDPAVAVAPAREMGSTAPAASAPPPPTAPTIAAADPRPARPAERQERAKAAPPPPVAAAPAAPPAAPPAAAEAERRTSPALASRAPMAADAGNEAAATAALKPRTDVASPLAAPRRGLRTEPEAWTWQRGSQDPMPVNDALRQWLDKLEAAADGRWEAIKSDPPNARGLATLTLLREERIHTIVRLETDGVSRRGSVRMRASLEPAVASQLARELGQIAP